MNTVLCHIVGLDPYEKNSLINFLNKKKYNIIDLDDINQNIFNNEEVTQLFNKYDFFKKAKNDKYKDIEKKITKFWEENMKSNIENNSVKKTIIIGFNNHFRNLSKKININTNNKFLIKCGKKNIRKIIEYNLEKYKKDIIYGSFPLENINYESIKKNREKLDHTYIKIGYLIKTFDQIVKIINLLESKKIKDEGLWLCSNQPYNIFSKIHPERNKKLFGYLEPTHALISSFNWDDNELIKSYKGTNLKLTPKTEDCLEKLKQKRFLYYVEHDTFIPYEKGNNIKFCSQVPVTIIEKERISNVYKKLKSLDII